MTDIASNQALQTNTGGSSLSPLDRRTEHNIHVFSAQSREAINDHLQELKNEWSIERIIEAGASALAIIGLALGAFVSPWCLILPAIIGVFHLSHAVFNFSPALTSFQGKGTRTNCEIGAEKFAMKVLRNKASVSSDTDNAALAEHIIEETRAYSAAE